MPRPLVLAATMLGLALALAPAAFGRDYEIKFERPFRVGQEFGFTATGQVTYAITAVSDKTPKKKTQEFAYEVEASAKVLAVDKIGRPTRLSLTLTKCTRTEGKETTDLIEKSTSVIASAKGPDERVFEVKGKSAPAALKDVLKAAVPLSGGGPSDDEVLGTKERKKPGDRWNLNAEAAAKSAIQGTATLDQTVRAGGVDCLLFHCVVTMKRVPFSLPEGCEYESGSTRIDYRIKLPVDTALGRVEETSLATGHCVGTAKPDAQGPEVRLDVVMNAKRTIRYTYPPPAAKKK